MRGIIAEHSVGAAPACAEISVFLAWSASTSMASRTLCWRLAGAGAAGGAMSSSSSAASRLSLLFWSFLLVSTSSSTRGPWGGSGSSRHILLAAWQAVASQPPPCRQRPGRPRPQIDGGHGETQRPGPYSGPRHHGQVAKALLGASARRYLCPPDRPPSVRLDRSRVPLKSSGSIRRAAPTWATGPSTRMAERPLSELETWQSWEGGRSFACRRSRQPARDWMTYTSGMACEAQSST